MVTRMKKLFIGFSISFTLCLSGAILSPILISNNNVGYCRPISHSTDNYTPNNAPHDNNKLIDAFIAIENERISKIFKDASRIHHNQRKNRSRAEEVSPVERYMLRNGK